MCGHWVNTLEQGVQALKAGKLLVAENLFRAALHEHPDSVDALARLGETLQFRGHLQAAIECRHRVLEHSNKSAESFCNLAAALAEAGQYDNALQVLARATARLRADPRLAAARGAVLCAAGRYAEALAPLHSVWDNQGNDELPAVNLASALRATGKVDDALAVLRAGTDVLPGHTRLAAELAETLLGAARVGEALKFSNEWLADHGPAGALLAVQATALWEAGRDGEHRKLMNLERDITVSHLPQIDCAALAQLIRADKSLMNLANKAIGGGAQTGELDPDAHPALRELVHAVVGSPGTKTVAALSHLRFRATVLSAGGYQVPHHHPQALTSAVFWVEVPPASAAANDQDDAGAIEFGRPPARLRWQRPPLLRMIQPQAGMLVRFPSWFWQGTRPFAGSGELISVTFNHS
jgi:tetratricopeptide (TPR) repeat protein